MRDLQPRPPFRRPGAQGRGRRVLVVDDDAEFCSGLSEALECEGYLVASAHSVAEAMAAIEKFDAEVAILDFRLGSDCGLDLVEPLQERLPGLIAILSTANTDLETAIASLRRGVFDYFLKPLHLDGLLKTLERCFLMLDLERQKQVAEQRLQEARKAEAVVQVAGGVAHHFNNMLAVLKGRLELLAEGLGGDEEQLDHVASMEKMIARATNINQSLLAYSGQQILVPRPADLKAFIEQSADEWRAGLKDTTTLALDTSPVSLVEFDALQLKSAIWQLLKNAEKAMPVGGTVSITLRPGGESSEDPPVSRTIVGKAFVVLAVSDSGRGMPETVVKGAFEPFFSERGLAESAGLGLSVVYGIVKQLGGEVGLQSAMGQGTVVTIFLPSCRPSGPRREGSRGGGEAAPGSGGAPDL